VNDSWEAFANALQTEAALLARVADASTRLTQALVNGNPETISGVERELDTDLAR
jgi:hypothetical protein